MLLGMMSFKLPQAFLAWWFIKAPKLIFTTGKRLLILVDSSLSFTLNLRLIFTPLFGDYTIIGRFIGLVVRLIEIVFGLIFTLILGIAILLLPVVWIILPAILYKFTGLLIILEFTGFYLFWVWSNRDTPDVKIPNLKDNDFITTFRPKAKFLVAHLKSDPQKGIKFMLSEKEILYILVKTELMRDDFITKILETPSFDHDNLEKNAFDIAKEQKTRYVEIEHIYLAFLTSIPKIDIVLATFGTDLASVKKAVDWVVSDRESLAKIYIWQEDCDMLITGGIGKGMTGRVTPLLDSISEDFTRMAKTGRLKKIVDREKEIKQIADILTGSKKNVLITGDAGSGKSSIVRGIAYKIIAGTEYKGLTNKRIVSLDIGSLIAGSGSAGDIANRLTKVIEEIRGSGGIILFIDEIHNLVAGAGDKNAETSTIFSILEPWLISDSIQFIGATSIPNYRKYIEPNGAFARLFNLVEIKEASKEDTLEILKFNATKYEKKYGVLISYPSMQTIVQLSQKLIHERVLPDKAIDILNRTVTRVANSTKYVTTREVEKEISDMTHIPVETVSSDEAEKLLNIENEMKKSVIGQDHAIKQISSALKRARVGIRDESKPIASFLFVGTTGVGKTQTAKSLAKSYFGDSKAMIRIDMSEYQQLDSISRLIGAPDGSSKGVLTEQVRTKPFALILLDEIEKAHPNILLMFLQVLDDGRLTDSSGTTVDFTNSIIIATSNVGTRSIQDVFEKSGSFDEMSTAALKDVREKFAPEFLNRFTGIIVFNPLSMSDVEQITGLMLTEIQNIVRDKGIKVTFTDDLVKELMKRGYSPEWGARPLARIIEDSVESYLATKMLKNEVRQGDEILIGQEVFSE